MRALETPPLARLVRVLALAQTQMLRPTRSQSPPRQPLDSRPSPLYLVRVLLPLESLPLAQPVLEAVLRLAPSVRQLQAIHLGSCLCQRLRLENHPSRRLRSDSRASLHRPSANHHNHLRHSVNLHNHPQPLDLLALVALHRRIHLQQLLHQVDLDSLVRHSGNLLSQHLPSGNHPSLPRPLDSLHSPIQPLDNLHSPIQPLDKPLSPRQHSDNPLNPHRLSASQASRPQHSGNLRNSPRHSDNLRKQIRRLVSPQRSGKLRLLLGKQVRLLLPSANPHNPHNQHPLSDNQVSHHLGLANRHLERVRLLSDNHRRKAVLSVAILHYNNN